MNIIRLAWEKRLWIGKGKKGEWNMNNGMQGGDNQHERKVFRDIIACLPTKPFEGLDLGSGISFAFERSLLKYRGGYNRLR